MRERIDRHPRARLDAYEKMFYRWEDAKGQEANKLLTVNYTVADFFDENTGAYLGPCSEGIEPVFSFGDTPVKLKIG